MGGIIRIRKRAGGRHIAASALSIAASCFLSLAIPAGPLSAVSVESRTDQSEQRDLERLFKVQQAAQRDDCKTVLDEGRPLVGGSLGGEYKSIAYVLIAVCEMTQGQGDKALEDAINGSRIEGSLDFLWQLRLDLTLELDRQEAAVVTIQEMAHSRVDALNTIELRAIWALHNKLKEASENDLRTRLLRALSEPTYLPEGSADYADSFRSLYAELALSTGDMEAARTAVSRLRSPSALASALVNPGLRPFLPKDLDFRQSAEASLARARERMARQPDRLEAVLDVASALRLLGKPAEALALLEEVRPRIEDSKAFVDLDDNLNWYWNSVAKTHRKLGHYEDTVAAYQRGTDASEGGGANVSQVINLSSAQLEFNRPKDALRTLAVFKQEKRSLSPYGELQVRKARGCAHALLGQTKEASEDLAYAVANLKADASAETELKLCMGDMDGAARSLIQQLQDPDERTRLLLIVADYADPPVALSPDPIEVKWDALTDRPDVQAAIERAGGLQRFPLQAGEW